MRRALPQARGAMLRQLDYDDGDSLYFPEPRNDRGVSMGYKDALVKRFFLRVILVVLLFIVMCAIVDYADYEEKCDICGADAPFTVTITGHRVNAGGSTLEKVIDTISDFMRDNTETNHFCAEHYGAFMEWERNAAQR